MIATLVNAAVVIACALLGNFLQRGFPDRLRTLLMQALGICIVVVGLRMVLDVSNDIVIVLSIAIGTVIGHFCQLDRHLDNLGVRVKQIAKVDDARFVDGFVSASLLFCVGAMAIVGSFEAGLNQNYSILFTKSVLDGIMAIVLGSTLGIGVAFSAVAVILYQGALTLLAGLLSPVLTDLVVSYMSAAGGIMIMAIGITTAGIREINTVNTLPGLLVAAAARLYPARRWAWREKRSKDEKGQTQIFFSDPSRDKMGCHWCSGAARSGADRRWRSTPDDGTEPCSRSCLWN